MSQDTLFELPAPDVFRMAVVPACGICGARGPRIEEDDFVPRPHLMALVAINEHTREMHPTTNGEDR